MEQIRDTQSDNIQVLSGEPPFGSREQLRQSAYFEAEFPGKIGYEEKAFRLQPGEQALNLAPAIRDVAMRYMRDNKIAWHADSNHARSSQVCCLNFLMPLAANPGMLSRVIGDALGIASPKMLEVESGPDGRPWFIGFEWNGRKDYLNEGDNQGKRTRGSNSTSVDAVVRFRHDGSAQTLLIEWKYTESYGGPIKAEGNAARIKRYQNLVFAPDGPVRDDLGGPIRDELGLKLEDFFYEPFYQLLRQQMLAFQMQRLKEDGANRVRVLHIAPAANLALTRVTSPALKRFGNNAFTVFRSLLTRPEDFVSRSTESLFGPLMSDLNNDWAAYLARRYAFLADATEISR
jgi:hypothetical protein